MAHPCARLVAPVLLIVLLLGAGAAVAATVQVGDLVVAEPTLQRVTAVDIDTGATQVISSAGALVSPLDTAFEPGGTLVVADPGAGALIRVAIPTGSQTTISSGGLLSQPERVAVAPNGDLVVVDLGTQDGALIRVDPQTGSQTLLASVSGGSGLADPAALAIEADGQMVVAEADVPAVSRVDPDTGDATLLSLGFPYLTTAADVMDIAVEDGGDLLMATTFGSPASTAVVFRVDPVTGVQQLTPVGSGSSFSSMALEASGDVIVTVPIFGVFRIDNGSGTQTSIASLFNAFGVSVKRAQCDDGFDNDGDGDTDLDDAQCSGPADNRERPGACGLGFEVAPLLALLARRRRRRA